MAALLKQSTAVDIALGPFVDSTDGVTAETALTISQADVRLKKNGGAWAQKSDTNSATHEENGWYEVALNTTDTNTLGVLMVAVNESGALPVWREFMVVPANMYDSLVAGSDNLQVDAVQVEGSDATDQINAACDTALTDYDAPTNAEMVARTLATADYATATALATVAGYIDTEVAAIKAKTDNLPASPAAVSDIPSASTVAAAVLAAVVDGTNSLAALTRGFAAVLLGKASGLGTTTATFRDVGDSKDVIVATVDTDGNRSAITRDLT